MAVNESCFCHLGPDYACLIHSAEDRALAKESATGSRLEIERLSAEIERLRKICFQAWWGFKVLRGQRPEDPAWTDVQRRAMGELDRLIEVTHGAFGSKESEAR